MLIQLPSLWIVILDIIAWFILHMGISLLMLKVPDRWFEKEHALFKTRDWEQNGAIWQKIFRIREWKNYLPDSSSIIKRSYDQSQLQGTDAKRIKKFITETKRAELTHWLSIPPSLLFFIWNPLWAGIVMILYAFIVNLPFIITQRYNRPRLQRLYDRQRRKQENIYSKQKYYT
ncbi:MAG TPA: hypothetical protein VK021_04265 [Flavobacteriaceae bacterium]|nr:hypothetical protein [Flavobacteriaceae bacterium]